MQVHDGRAARCDSLIEACLIKWHLARECSGYRSQQRCTHDVFKESHLVHE
jgi:hypothetical protein